MEAIKTIGLGKDFGSVKALSDVNLTVGEGELLGLLGVNGAGKTTLIRVLCGLTKPTSGEAYIFGKSIGTDMAAIKEITDISPQETSVALNLTVRENLDFFASVYYSGKEERKARIDEIIEDFKLSEVLEKKARTLSGGWQRRLSIAVALVSKPKVLFLDEPTLGLDVLARRDLWRIIKQLKGNVTVLLTSHYLEEIEALSDRVAVLINGRLTTVGTVEEIMTATGESSFENAFVKIAEGELI